MKQDAHEETHDRRFWEVHDPPKTREKLASAPGLTVGPQGAFSPRDEASGHRQDHALSGEERFFCVQL